MSLIKPSFSPLMASRAMPGLPGSPLTAAGHADGVTLSRPTLALVPRAAVPAVRRQVEQQALAILDGNRVHVTHAGRRFSFSTPSLSDGAGDSHLDYAGKQWLWDSAFHAMILAKTRPAEARDELRAIFAFQRKDGFVPHMNYFGGDGRQVPPWAHPLLEQYMGGPVDGYWSSPYHSDITQPPVIAEALEAVDRAHPSATFLKQMLPKLCRYYDYLHDQRGDKDGLLRIIHPWESGWDNSQRWDEAIGLQGHAAQVPSRRDIDVRKMRLMALAKKADWNLQHIYETADFVMKPVDFNVLYVKNLEALSRLCTKAGDRRSAQKYAAWADTTRRAVLDKMWDGHKYVDLQMTPRGERRSTVESAAMFYPLLLDGERHGASMIRDYLANPRKFHSPLGMPTVALDHPFFEADQYWRGNLWVNVNVTVGRGLQHYLRRHPQDAVARRELDRLERSTLTVLSQKGFYEYFDVYDGHGHGVPSFGWNGLATVEFV
jgi:glycogen debranching enzyme